MLSLVHASIPSHWLPLVAVGKSEKWSRKETLSVTAIAGFAHTLSTIIIGIIVGLVGYKLSSSYKFISTVAAPAVLLILGFMYILADYEEQSHKLHRHHIDVDETIKGKTKSAIVTSLAVAMFFSPCLEIEVYFFVASSLGWAGIVTVSLVYLFVTIAGMLLLVFLASKGIEALKWHFLEHHEKLISGIVLILIGILGFFE